MKKKFTKKQIKNFLLINLGTLLVAVAYSIFLDANNLSVGGAFGLATISREVVNELFKVEISTSVFYLGYNVLLLFFALIFLGKKFFFGTIYASLISPVYTYLLELLNKYFLEPYLNLPNITKTIASLEGTDAYKEIIGAGAYLLIIVISAVIAGAGIGLALKYGASTGGTDILQAMLLKYFKIPYSIGIILTDGAVVLLACFYHNSFFQLLYGIIFVVVSGYVLDSIVFSGFNVRAVYIVTKEPVKVKNAIYKNIARGTTELVSKSGYKNDDVVTLMCVMSSSEFFKMKPIIQTIDNKTFIYAVRATEVHGEGFSYESKSETNLLEEEKNEQ